MNPSAAYDPEELPEDQPERLSPKTISLWLVAMGLAVFFVTLYLTSANLRSQVADLQGELEPIQATLTAVNTPPPQVLQLGNALAQVEASIKAIDALKPTIAASHINWPAVMASLGSYDPTQLTLTSLVQRGNEITVKGRATSDAVVAAYARSLESTNLYERVVIQSIKALATPLPTAVTTPTPAPTVPPTASPTATCTSTPDLRDPYEPDDTQAKDIYLGQSQLHNFYPAGDVDRVRFLAKAGRLYRVYTSDLAPGVDTLLTVRVGQAAYTSDDSKPGTLRSEVILQVPLGQDLEAEAEIRNRASYGPEMTYRVAVEELIPTPTATATCTPTSWPTNTPLPVPGTPPPQARGPVVPAGTEVAPGTLWASYRKPCGSGLLAISPSRAAAFQGTEFVLLLVLKAGTP